MEEDGEESDLARLSILKANNSRNNLSLGVVLHNLGLNSVSVLEATFPS